MQTVERCAAGIDIGGEMIFVAVPDQRVRSFSTFTKGLLEAAAFLKRHNVTTVAMEATGNLWIPLYEILDRSGIEVCLVNPAHARMIAGRKSDVRDCQWLQYLHSCGLLRASFIPEESTRALRSYMRLRGQHRDAAALQVVAMHRALELMNVKLQNVISQIQGPSGMRILEAIVAGQTDAHQLAALAEKRITDKKYDAVVASLDGFYKPEYVFALSQAIECWRFLLGQTAACDQAIEKLLEDQTRDLPTPEQPIGPLKPIRHNAPDIDQLHEKLWRLLGGSNPTTLPGFNDKTVLELISETGIDMSPWATSRQFASWLKLSPGSNSSGKRKKHFQQGSAQRAAQIFRMSAQSIGTSKNLALKGFYMRIQSRSGAAVAITATARKLAVLYYSLLRYGADYVEEGLATYEQRHKERRMKSIMRQAAELGLNLVPAT